MPFSSGALHQSFRCQRRGLRGALLRSLCDRLAFVGGGARSACRTALVTAALGMCSGATACDNSESPSPFVVEERDAGADARVTEAGTPPPPVPDAGQGPAAPGEWGGPCLDDGQCSDGIDCTADQCDPGRRQCHFIADDSPCDDGTFCNGAEVCVAGLGCRPGNAVACSDG